MTDTDQRDRPRSSLAVWLAVGVVLLPIAYVLSIGPVAWLAQRGYVPHRVYGSIYGPLYVIASYCEPIQDALLWYLHLWIFWRDGG